VSEALYIDDDDDDDVIHLVIAYCFSLLHHGVVFYLLSCYISSNLRSSSVFTLKFISVQIFCLRLMQFCTAVMEFTFS